MVEYRYESLCGVIQSEMRRVNSTGEAAYRINVMHYNLEGTSFVHILFVRRKMMNCPRCGAPMSGGVCPECGFPITCCSVDTWKVLVDTWNLRRHNQGVK